MNCAKRASNCPLRPSSAIERLSRPRVGLTEGRRPATLSGMTSGNQEPPAGPPADFQPRHQAPTPGGPQYSPPPGQYGPPPGQYGPPPGQYGAPPGQYGGY